MPEIKLKPQQQRIIDYITSFGGITTLQAYNDLGITSLPSRISELRRLGYQINKKHITVRNRFNEKCCIVFYSFAEESKNDIPHS